MLAPIDLVNDRFKRYVARFGGFRPYQLETALRAIAAFDKGVKFVLIQAPTGIGKTLIAVLVAAMLELQLRYTCHSKQLQAQFCDDFPDAIELLGRNNYHCLKNPDLFPKLSAELCTYTDPHCKSCVLKDRGCAPDGEGKCPCRTDCPYFVRKQMAMDADIAVLNTQYLLNVLNFGSGFAPVPLLVLDEFDQTENPLLKGMELSFSERFLDKFGLPRPRPREKPDHEWAQQCLQIVEQRIDRLRGTWGIDDLRSIHELEQKRRQLQFFIREVDDKNWVFDGSNWKPVWAHSYAHTFLWQYPHRVLGMSATMSPSRQLCHDVGITGSMEFIDVPSVFPPDRRRIHYCPAANMSYGSKEAEFPKLVTAVDNVLDQHPDKKGLVQCVSYGNVDQIMRLTRYPNRLITHSAHDRQSKWLQFMESAKPMVLLSPSAERGIDLPYDCCRFIIIAKVPFPYLGDPQVAARLYRGKSAGRAWYEAATARRIVQATGRGMRAPDDFCVSYILDAAFGDFYSRNIAMFPRWWRESLILPPKGGDA